MSNQEYKNLPLVYSCSGCSNVAQLANEIALKLDKDKVAEMSCIAGVGGGVPALLKIANSKRDIFVLDGCPLSCAKRCLENQKIPIMHHIDISQLGVKKAYHEKCDNEAFSRIWDIVFSIIKRDNSGDC